MFIQLNNKKLVNVKRLAGIIPSLVDETKIDYILSSKEIVSDKFDTKSEAEEAIKNFDDENFMEVGTAKINKLYVKNVEINVVNNCKVEYTLFNIGIVKATYEDAEKAKEALEKAKEALLSSTPAPTPVDPEITSVTVNTEKSFVDPVSVGTKIASVVVSGGTKPYTYTAGGGTNDDKFTIESENITAKEELQEGSYTFKVKVTDSKSKEKVSEDVSITVDPKPIPEIDSVTISPEAKLVDTVEIGTKVATINVGGGTEPFTFAAGGGENDDQFNISDKEITAKSQLTEGSYKVKAKVTDKNKKEKISEETTITVAKKPDPEITNVTIDFPKGLKVGDPQTKAKAKIADIVVEGGTPPYLPLMTGGASDEITVASTELFVGNADLTAKTYQIKIKVCDSKQKDYDYTGEFTVSPADE